jgi:hypothetical protein
MVTYLEFKKINSTYIFEKPLLVIGSKLRACCQSLFFVGIQSIKDILERYICKICNSMICIFVEFAKINFDIKQNYFKIK